MSRIVALAGLLCLAAQALGQDTIHHDFRGGKFDADLFRIEGPNADHFIKPEAEGLRWLFSKGNAPNRPAGVAWKFPVRGDFVATAHYEILNTDELEKARQGRLTARAVAVQGLAASLTAPVPPQVVVPFGIATLDEAVLLDWEGAVELYLMLDTTARDGVSISRRVHRPFVFIHLTDNKVGQRYAKEYRLFPATPRNNKGRLRLARHGSALTVSIAEGDRGAFQELHRSEMGTMGIRMIRFAGMPGRMNSTFDMRLLDFELQYNFPAAARAAAANPSPGTPEAADNAGRGQRLLIFAVIAFIVSAAVLAFYLRRRQKSRPPLANAGENSSGLVNCTCSACGKKLRVKNDRIGKHIKCPSCGQATEVTASG